MLAASASVIFNFLLNALINVTEVNFFLINDKRLTRLELLPRTALVSSSRCLRKIKHIAFTQLNSPEDIRFKED